MIELNSWPCRTLAFTTWSCNAARSVPPQGANHQVSVIVRNTDVSVGGAPGARTWTHGLKAADAGPGHRLRSRLQLLLRTGPLPLLRESRVNRWRCWIVLCNEGRLLAAGRL